MEKVKLKLLFCMVGVLFITMSCEYSEALDQAQVMTVLGPVAKVDLGNTLIHEHVLVDFIGADSTGYHRWDRAEAAGVILAFLYQIKNQGISTIMECTPAFLGRDPLLLQQLSKETGLNIITNTGLYGAVDNKYIPKYAYTESAEQLADRWIAESENGIEDTGVRPGFMKISVNPTPLSELHTKLVRAAALTHKATGLTIASHTGPAIPAFEQLEVLQQEGVDPSAFIWVHAQNESDLNQHVRAASMGAWISLDGLGDNNLDRYLEMVENLRDAGFLNKILISHDAGWYDPEQPEGKNYRPHTTLMEHFIPMLRKNGFSETEINQLLVSNPWNAFAIRKRLLDR